MLGKSLRSRFWLALLLLVVLGLTASLILRRELAEWALTKGLEDQGLRVTSLSVTQVGWRQGAVRNLAVDAPGVSFALQVADLDYELFDLLSGGLPAVFLSGAALDLDLNSPWLQNRRDAAGKAGEVLPSGEAAPLETKPLPRLPDVTFEDVAIRLLTPLGPLELDLEGSIWRAPSAAQIGAVSLTAKAAQGQTAALAGFTLTGDRSLLADVFVEEGDLDIGSLSLRGLSGSLAAAIDGPSGRVQKLEAEASLARLSGALSADIALSPLGISFNAALEGQDILYALNVKSAGQAEDKLEAQMKGRIEPSAEAVTFTASSQVATSANLALFARFPWPLPQAGRISGAADITAVLPPLAEMRALEIWTLQPEDWLPQVSSATVGFSLQTDKLSQPDYLEDLSSDFAGRVELDEQAVALRLAGPVRAEVARIAPTLLDELSLPRDSKDWLDGPVKLELKEDEDQPLLQVARAHILRGPYRLASAVLLDSANFSMVSAPSGEFVPAANTWRFAGPVTLESSNLPMEGFGGPGGRLDLDFFGDFESAASGSGLAGVVVIAAEEILKDDIRLTGLRFEAPVQAKLTGDRFRGWTTLPAEAAADAITTAAGRSTKPLGLSVFSAELEADLASGAMRPSLAARLAPTAFAIKAGATETALESDAVAFSLSPGRGESANLTLKLEAKAVTAPEVQARLADIAVDAEFNPVTKKIRGQFIDLTLSDLAQPPRFEDVVSNGSFELISPDRMLFALEGHSFRKAIEFSASGRSDPDKGFSIDFLLPPHDFSETPLQLDGLSWISDSSLDSGQFEGRLQLEMSPSGPVGTASFASQGIAGRALGFPFSGLGFALDLDGLWPPRASNALSISLARFNPGLPARDLEVEAFLPGAEPFTLELRKAAFSFLGARILLDGSRLALLDGTADLPIRIVDLDLARVLEAADLADVDVTGRLDGDLPVRFGDGTVTIRRSQLAATEPGVLRLRSEEVSSLLGGYGDEVSAMLQALEDFRYDDLSLTLEKTPEDDLTLLLSILGKNPAVLDGQPFKINLNLESNIGQLLDTLGKGLEISKDLLSGRYSLE